MTTTLYNTQLKILIGATIVQAGYVPCEDFNGAHLPVLVLQLPSGHKVTLLALADAEGKAPGWLDLQRDETVMDKV